MRLKRLFRRLRYLFRDLDWPYESCIDCGRVFRIAWSVRNKVWRRVVGGPHAGCLCLDCFLVRASRMRVPVRVHDITWIATFDPPFQMVDLIDARATRKGRRR